MLSGYFGVASRQHLPAHYSGGYGKFDRVRFVNADGEFVLIMPTDQAPVIGEIVQAVIHVDSTGKAALELVNNYEQLGETFPVEQAA